MKKSIILSLVGCSLLLSQNMKNYCAIPPFAGAGEDVRPYCLLMHDVSNYFRYPAYHPHTRENPGDDDYYDATRTYYGLCNPSKMYKKVQVGQVPIRKVPFIGWIYGPRYFFQQDPGGTYSGNFVNWCKTQRLDIAKKILTGGKSRSCQSPAYQETLYFHDSIPEENVVAYLGGGNIVESMIVGVITTPGDTIEITRGVIRDVIDTNDDFMYDESAPRFGLWKFRHNDQGLVATFTDPLTVLVDSINLMDTESHDYSGAGGWFFGGLGPEALLDAVHYFAYRQPYCDAASYDWNINDVATPKDPFYEYAFGETVSVFCRPCFIVYITPGVPHLNDEPKNAVPYFANLYDASSPYGASYDKLYDYNGWDVFDLLHIILTSRKYDGKADEIAYYAHINDLRPDTDPTYGLQDKQTLTFYTVFAYSHGLEVGNLPVGVGDTLNGLDVNNLVAKYGGFEDQNGNNMPDLQSEWDEDGDSIANNCYVAEEAEDVKEVFTTIFQEIMALTRVTSATSFAISSAGGTSGAKKGGLATLAQFYAIMDTLEDPMWTGRVQGLWMDPFGYLREDTDVGAGNRKLHLKNDYVVEMFFTEVGTKCNLYEDPLGIGDEFAFVLQQDSVPVESLKFVWDGEQWLRNASPNARKIYTNINGSRADFLTTNSNIDAHLGFGGSSSCDSLINYIRGTDYTPWRSRQWLDGNVWKLGDIIYSSPMPVGSPSEAYDLIYGDNSYRSFWDAYKNRRTVVYTGANDGMLHAFNVGTVNALDSDILVAEVDPMTKTLGQELWAYVPYNLLPHLKWLKEEDYKNCHVYYVDLRPYPTDVQIFADDAIHPNGWGTILVSGMRLGGSKISVGGNTYRSSYSCLDITNPEDGTYPGLLWEFTDDSLGHTMCLPTVIKVQNKWFLIFGSGPQTLHGESTQQAKLYVIDLSDGSLARRITIPDNNTAITNIFAADWGLNYSVDLIYFGTYDNAGGGKIYRMLTHESNNPADWDYYEVIDLGKPITAEGTVATDGRGNLWVYFGTGKYFSHGDVVNKDTMLFVGIKDDTSRTTPISLNDLVDVTNVDVYGDSVTGISGIGNFDELVNYVDSAGGWYREFDSMPGERIINPPLVFSGALVFTSYIPKPARDTTDTIAGGDTIMHDLCIPDWLPGQSKGSLWALFYLTGTAYKIPILDTTATGKHTIRVSIMGDMPAEPTWYMDKIYVQSGGGLTGPDFVPPYSPYEGIMLWRGR